MQGIIRPVRQRLVVKAFGAFSIFTAQVIDHLLTSLTDSEPDQVSQLNIKKSKLEVVGGEGFEPPTPAV